MLIKVLLATVIYLLVLGMTLFWPAGTYHFYQAWLYLAVIFVIVWIFNIYFMIKDPALLARRMKTREKEKRQKLLRALVMPLYLGLFVFAGFDHRYGWSNVPFAVVIIAEVFVALGYAIVFITFLVNSYASAIIETEKTQKVVSTGPYRLVRHPMYSGALLMMLATPVALGSFWALLFIPPFTAVIVARLLDEEKFLAQDLPGYEEYRQKVRHRLIPGIW